MLAVQHKNLDFVRLLLDHNANMDARLPDGATPMFMAAERGDCDIASLLLERGAQAESGTDRGESSADNANVRPL